MKKNIKTKTATTKFRWQPEIARSIIYWSVAFTMIFICLISIIEEEKLTILSVLTFIIFCLLSYGGQCRYFELSADEFYVHSLFKKNCYKFPLNDLQKVLVGSSGITLSITGFEDLKEEKRSFLMTKKSKHGLIESLESMEQFQGKVISIKKSVS